MTVSFDYESFWMFAQTFLSTGYDQAKNPFADAAAASSTNPFDDEDD